MTDQSAVVLLSGGLDSSTVMAIAQSDDFSVYALTVNYGQRHVAEIEAAEKVGRAMNVAEHRFMEVDLRGIGQSALTDDIAVPTDRSAEEMNAAIPVTYVPARNTVLLSCALAYAESIGAFDIFVGVNALDYAGYPDCRPEYIAAFQQMANLATKQAVESDRGLRIHAPLIHLTKTEIIRKGLELGVDYALSSTCYAPSQEGHACGHCDACLLRLEGFAEVGIADPVAYQSASGGAA
ncbi:MAG: 7-cyano-7-deazaguanine synthase QueC [Planctomycetaceae bacterium]